MSKFGFIQDDGSGIPGPPGPRGLQGQSATIAVGTTTTLAPGSSATVTNSGTSLAAVFDFGIPQGVTGPQGNPATATNPITNELVVFASTSTSPTAIKSADAPVTLGQGLTVTGAVSCTTVQSTRFDLTAASANPGGVTTIWADSTTSNSLRYGAGNVLVDPAPTVANAIPVYTGTGGQVDTFSSGTNATLSRPLYLTPPNNSNTPISFYSLSAGRMLADFINGNAGATHMAGVRVGGNAASQRWTFGNDYAASGGDDMFLRRDATTPVYALQATSAGFVTTPNGVGSSRYDLISSASNPGGSSTIWLDSAATTRPKFGSTQLALMSDTGTATNPIVDGIVVFGGTTTNPDLKTPTTTVTCPQPISIGGMGGSGNTTCLQLTSASVGSTKMTIFNTSSSGASIDLGQPTAVGSSTWYLNTGSSTNDFSLAARTVAGTGGATTNVIYVDAGTSAVAGVVQCQYGVQTKRLDLTAVSANPGGTNTVWLDSAATTRPKFGSSPLALLSDVGSYSTTTVSATMSGALTSTVTLTLTKFGNVVVLSFPTLSGTIAATDNVKFANGTLPAGYFPSGTNKYGSIQSLKTSPSQAWSLSWVEVNVAGGITIGLMVPPSGDKYTSGDTYTFNPGSVTYLV